MYSKERQPPRFVPTLTEVVAEDVAPQVDVLGEVEEPAAVVGEPDTAAGAVWPAASAQREESEVLPAVGALPSEAEENLAQQALPVLIQPAVAEASEAAAVAATAQPDWQAVCAQVELQVQSCLPQLLEPLWQQFQLDASLAIQACVQQTLAQELARAQGKAPPAEF